jgi:hypothetical protein
MGMKQLMNWIPIGLVLAVGCTPTSKEDNANSKPVDDGHDSVDASDGTPSQDTNTSGDSDSGSTAPTDTAAPPSWSGSDVRDRQARVDAMVTAAQTFLGGLDELQRGQIKYSFHHPERSDWSNLPHAVYARRGVSLGELNEENKALGWNLIRVSLSAAGLQRTKDIVQIEKLLWESGDMNAFPGNYFFTFFDEPSSEARWGWQLDGHHLALNFTVAGPEVTIAPSLWGTSPTTWPSGEYAGLSPMADEENLAFEWIAGLTEDQLASAQLNADGDPDLMAGPNSIQTEWPEPRGIPTTDLTAEQRDSLLQWISIYVGNLSEPQAAERMAEIEANLDDTSVAWMGSTRPGEMMYYRIQGSHVLIEFDHTRTADHIHAVYRDPANDYGVDWLTKHLAEHHSTE